MALMKSCKFLQLVGRWYCGNISKQLMCTRVVQFHPCQNVAHEEHLAIIWCRNNDSLRKGKKENSFDESSEVMPLNAGKCPPGAMLVITLLYLL